MRTYTCSIFGCGRISKRHSEVLSINLKNNQAASMKKFLTKLYQTYPKHLNKNHILIGNIMCHLNQTLRKLIYRFIRIKS